MCLREVITGLKVGEILGVSEGVVKSGEIGETLGVSEGSENSCEGG